MLLFLQFGYVLADLILVFRETSQYSIHESRRAFGAELLSQFHRLVDGYLDGRILLHGEFPECYGAGCSGQ